MDGVVLINPFEVPAGREDEFVARWQEAADYMRRREGFVSTRLHQSLDPTGAFRFVNVAVWQSPEHFRRAVGTPEFQELSGACPSRATPRSTGSARSDDEASGRGVRACPGPRPTGASHHHGRRERGEPWARWRAASEAAVGLSVECPGTTRVNAGG